MTDHDYKADSAGHSFPADELDAALATYAVVEPRAGLEERILAGLRAERERGRHMAWWRWPALAALAAVVIVVALALALKPKVSPPQTGARRPPRTEQSVPEHMTVATTPRSNGRTRRSPPAYQPKAQAVAAIIEADVPRLEQFPSPKPLSEQERMLVRYVADYPERAALIAEARAELLRREAREEPGNGSADHSQEKFQ